MGPVKRKPEGTAVFLMKKAKLTSPKRGHNTQKPGSKNDSAAHVDPITQEPPSQGEGADTHISETIPDTAQGGPVFVEFDIKNYKRKKQAYHEHLESMDVVINEDIFEGITQEPLTQKVKEASKPQATQEPDVLMQATLQILTKLIPM